VELVRIDHDAGSFENQFVANSYGLFDRAVSSPTIYLNSAAEMDSPFGKQNWNPLIFAR
jgi:hypothetical protein